MNIQIQSPADDQLPTQLMAINTELTTLIASGNTTPVMLQRIIVLSKQIQERSAARVQLYKALDVERCINAEYEKMTHPREGVRSVHDLTDFSKHEQDPTNKVDHENEAETLEDI